MWVKVLKRIMYLPLDGGDVMKSTSDEAELEIAGDKNWITHRGQIKIVQMGWSRSR